MVDDADAPLIEEYTDANEAIHYKRDLILDYVRQQSLLVGMEARTHEERGREDGDGDGTSLRRGRTRDQSPPPPPLPKAATAKKPGQAKKIVASMKGRSSASASPIVPLGTRSRSRTQKNIKTSGTRTKQSPLHHATKKKQQQYKSTTKPKAALKRKESCREDEEENDNDDKSVDENEGGDAENNNGDDSYNDKLPPKKRVKAKGSRSAHLPTTVMENFKSDHVGSSRRLTINIASSIPNNGNKRQEKVLGLFNKAKKSDRVCFSNTVGHELGFNEQEFFAEKNSSTSKKPRLLVVPTTKNDATPKTTTGGGGRAKLGNKENLNDNIMISNYFSTLKPGTYDEPENIVETSSIGGSEEDNHEPSASPPPPPPLPSNRVLSKSLLKPLLKKNAAVTRNSKTIGRGRLSKLLRASLSSNSQQHSDSHLAESDSMHSGLLQPPPAIAASSSSSSTSSSFRFLPSISILNRGGGAVCRKDSKKKSSSSKSKPAVIAAATNSPSPPKSRRISSRLRAATEATANNTSQLLIDDDLAFLDSESVNSGGEGGGEKSTSAALVAKWGVAVSTHSTGSPHSSLLFGLNAAATTAVTGRGHTEILCDETGSDGDNSNGSSPLPPAPPNQRTMSQDRENILQDGNYYYFGDLPQHHRDAYYNAIDHHFLENTTQQELQQQQYDQEHHNHQVHQQEQLLHQQHSNYQQQPHQLQRLSSNPHDLCFGSSAHRNLEQQYHHDHDHSQNYHKDSFWLVADQEHLRKDSLEEDSSSGFLNLLDESVLDPPRRQQASRNSQQHQSPLISYRPNKLY